MGTFDNEYNGDQSMMIVDELMRDSVTSDTGDSNP
jgi:hypothetical protein